MNEDEKASTEKSSRNVFYRILCGLKRSSDFKKLE